MTTARKADPHIRVQSTAGQSPEPSAAQGAGPAAEQPQAQMPSSKRVGHALDDRLEALTAGLKSRGAQLAENVVYGMSRRGLENTSFDYVIADRPECRAQFQYGAEINHGFFGVIHHLTVTRATPELVEAFPLLFVDGVSRRDLVIKKPHDLPVLMPRKFDPVLALRDEIRDAALFADALRDAPIKGCSILLADGGRSPFAIKPFVTLTPIAKLAAAQDCKLSSLQLASMRRDIFDKAAHIFQSTGIGLDIKPQNAAYDAATDTWGMYECTRLPKGHEGYFVKGGFEAYVRLVESTMRKLAAKA